MGQAIAYVMSRFPHLPETFILREMAEMERHGWPIRLYPLMLQKQTVVHEEAKRWIPLAQSSPFLSPGVVAANAAAIWHKPITMAGAWARTALDYRRGPGELARALALLPKAAAMATAMRRDGVGHIHAHYATYPALAAWLIHRLTGIPYSVTVHAHDIYVSQLMLATKLRDAAAVIAISAFNREFLASHVGDWVRAKTHVIHCGIQPAQYQAPRDDAAGAGGRFEIVSTGSLQEYKGHRHLIDACALLRDRGLDFRCRIVGGGEDQAALQQQIEALGLGGAVELMGGQPQHVVAKVLGEADCYAQASIVTASGKMEGIPVALMEALAAGLPVVATAISGIPELVKPGETGYLVPPSDPAALADALQHVAAARGEARRLGLQGRKLVLDEFNLHTNVAQLSEVIARINPAIAPATQGVPGSSESPAEQSTLATA